MANKGKIPNFKMIAFLTQSMPKLNKEILERNIKN